jgi:hypothetical protein
MWLSIALLDPEFLSLVGFYVLFFAKKHVITSYWYKSPIAAPLKPKRVD